MRGRGVIPAQAGTSGRTSTGATSAQTLAEIPACAGMTE